MSRSRHSDPRISWKKLGLRAGSWTIPMHMMPGVWSGVTAAATREKRAARRACKAALAEGREPEPYRPRHARKYRHY